ncbi:MAG: class I adenylate-forming enzyme family protein [Thermoanaerobaculia bacterium]
MFEDDLLSERARVTPGKTALVYVPTGERWTYADLDRQTARAASSVMLHGVGPGDRFGVLSHNSLELVAFFFAAWKCGAIVVPLSTRSTPLELEAIVRDCGMKVLFAEDDFAEVAKGLPVEAQPLRIPDDMVSVSFPPPPASSEETLCLLYTSGTTGKPKGVMIPRRQLLWNGYNTVMNWGLRDDDVSPIFTPMYHAGGLAAFLIPLFCAGGTVVIHRGFNPAEVWEVIQRERCTVVLGVPTIWKMLMDAPAFATASLEHVRCFYSGGAPLPAYIIEAYQQRGVVFKQGFGMTEVGVNCFTMTVEESFAKRGSIGKPLMFTKVRLMDGEGREVRDGEVGEMYIAGPHVSKGYWNNPAATAESYLPGGWFRTGDLARRDADGFFYIAGRIKEMFISGGVNVYPAEIEAALVLHPAVSDAAVVPTPDEAWGEAGVAFVVGSNVTAEDLAAWLSSRIARFKVPKRFVFVDALPRTPYGNVEKPKLRAMLG